MANKNQAHTRLAEAMQHRLAELQTDWVGIAARSGVSTQTIRDIRFGRTRTIRETTKNALDDALKWQRGSIDAVLKGGTPTPLPTERRTIDHSSDIEQSAWVLRGAMEAGETVYTAAVERLKSRLPSSDLDKVFSRLTDIVLGDDERHQRRSTSA